MATSPCEAEQQQTAWLLPSPIAAPQIAQRFLSTVYATYQETGRMYEKFNTEQVNSIHRWVWCVGEELYMCPGCGQAAAAAAAAGNYGQLPVVSCCRQPQAAVLYVAAAVFKPPDASPPAPRSASPAVAASTKWWTALDGPTAPGGQGWLRLHRLNWL